MKSMLGLPNSKPPMRVFAWLVVRLFQKQLFSMYPRESRKQFQDLHTLLETMVNFRHLTGAHPSAHL